MEVGTITGENLAYTIRFYADPAKYSYYLPTIQRMIDSFQINNSGVEKPAVSEEPPTINDTRNQLPDGQPSSEQQQSSNTTVSPSGYSGINWSDKCQLVQPALYQSCDVLVNPDGSLTDQGRHALNCIKNGALLGGGAKLAGLPTWSIPLGG